MKIKINPKILSITLSVLVSIFLVAGVVLAVTTISTNIATDGNLTVSGNTTLGDANTDTITANSSITITGGTVTADAPVISSTQTWNAGAVTFNGIKLNVTDTASAAGSLLADLQVGGSSKFNISKAGNVTGPAANWTIVPNGAFGLTLGGASMTALTITTDGTGTAEVALPAGSIDSTEILDATIADADISGSAAITGTKINTNFGGQALITSGSVSVTGTGTLSIGGSATLNGGLTMDTDRFTVADTTGNTTIAGTLTIGGGTAITKIVVYSASLTPVATAAAIGTSSQTFTVTGLATTDKIIVNGPAPTSLCPMTGYRVSLADTLQLDFTTLTAVACTPAAGTYNIVAIRN